MRAFGALQDAQFALWVHPKREPASGIFKTASYIYTQKLHMETKEHGR